MKIISIDIGTTNMKASLLEYSGDEVIVREMVNTSHVERREGKVHEHSPRHIINEVKRLIQHLVRAWGQPDAIVFSNYLFSLVIVGRNGELLSNIITWLDRRSEEAVKHVDKYAHEIYRRTGCPPLYIYDLPKVIYFSRATPEIIRKSMLLDVKSMLMMHLTGEIVTDLSTASGTYQFLNIHTLEWDDYVLNLAGVSEDQLPRVEEGDYTLHLKPEVANEVGVSAKTPVVLGLYDGGSMIFGLTGGLSGVGVINMGTSSMLRVVSSKPIIDASGSMNLQTYYLYRSTWVPGSALNNCGIVLEYFAKLIGMKVEELISILYNVDVDRYLEIPTPTVIPLLYPERYPELAKDIGISIVGLREDMDIRVLIASITKGLVFMLKFIDEAVQSTGATYNYLVVGGKIAQIPLVRIVLANVFNREAMFTEVPDAVHLGNALMALTALKVASPRDVQKISVKFVKETVKPSPKVFAKLQREYELFKSILKSLYSQPRS